MAALGDSPSSTGRAAASVVLDREIEASIEGATCYPQGTVFVPRDLAVPPVLDRYRSEGLPVGVVSDDGSVEMFHVYKSTWPEIRPEHILFGVVLAGIVVWALSRRPPVHAHLAYMPRALS